MSGSELDAFVKEHLLKEIPSTPSLEKLLEKQELLMVTIDEGKKNFLGRPKEHKGNLSNEIGLAVAQYQLHKDLGTPYDYSCEEFSR